MKKTKHDLKNYSKPVINKINIIKSPQKTFSGCWNVGSNEDNGQDGC